MGHLIMPHICESVAWAVAFTYAPQPSSGSTRKIKEQDGHFSPPGGQDLMELFLLRAGLVRTHALVYSQ